MGVEQRQQQQKYLPEDADHEGAECLEHQPVHVVVHEVTANMMIVQVQIFCKSRDIRGYLVSSGTTIN